MRLLIILALVGLSLAAPQTPQVYAFDYYNHEENRAQFLRRNDETYSWGYEFPGRVHLESRDSAGQVEGSYGFVDANGSPVLVQYQAHPENGFTADVQQVQAVQAFPAARSEEIVPAEDVSPYSALVKALPEADVSPYTALLKELPLVGNLAAPAPLLKMVSPIQPALTPLLKAAVEAGKITQFEVLEDGSSTFAISNDAVKEAGSVSNLAVQLGASLPAAVHDVRSPNPSIQEPRPNLDYQGTNFVLRVPPADPRVGSLIVEI
ncbi:unnamed protein product [Meganyctiphanes norvegica]|uniref:Cuticle protein n=1 Tax=Meganyctiphanes norvegica TaxID=48144 RepID=A0AAV2SJ26_MEGNR